METFSYKAKDQEGKSVTGQVEARSERHAVQVLKERDYFVVNLKRQAPATFGTKTIFGGVSSKDLVQFTQQLSTMINAGMTLSDALALLQVQSKNKMSKIISEIAHDVSGGTSFGEALDKHPKVFSTVYRALVRAGETSGKLDEVLIRLTENEEKAQEFRAKTRGALVYPVIVSIAMVIVMTIILVFVIPQMTALYEGFGAELPLITQIMVSLGNFIKNFWWLIAIIGVGGYMALRAYYATPDGRMRLDGRILKLPIYGPLKNKIILAELTRTLALMVAAGVSILESMQVISQAADNAVIKKALEDAAREVEKGVPLATAFAKHQVFPLVMSQMMAVGEETGELAAILDKVSHYMSMEAEQMIKNLTTAIEPAMMIMLGIMVAIIAFTVFTPLYKITTMF